jgi:hypothetical protein
VSKITPGNRGWAVLTRDKRIRYRRLEKFALQAAGVRAFVFTGGNVTLADTATALASAIPAIAEISIREAGPCIYHIGRTGKPRRMV